MTARGVSAPVPPSCVAQMTFDPSGALLSTTMSRPCDVSWELAYMRLAPSKRMATKTFPCGSQATGTRTSSPPKYVDQSGVPPSRAVASVAPSAPASEVAGPSPSPALPPSGVTESSSTRSGSPRSAARDERSRRDDQDRETSRGRIRSDDLLCDLLRLFALFERLEDDDRGLFDRAAGHVDDGP